MFFLQVTTKNEGYLFETLYSLVLYYNVIQVSPERLVQAGVSVSRVVQSAGEFIVVFPQSFTANVGCGFSVSESLHFAPASWFPLGCSAAQVSVLYTTV